MRPSGRPGQRRARLLTLARIAVAAGILAYLAHEVAIPDILNALAAATPALLLIAFGVTLGVQFLVADRVRRLVGAQALRITSLEFFGINLATLFYGLFLPAGNVTGIVVRYFSLARREGAHAGVALALLVDRLVATTTLCLVGLGFWLLVAPRDSWPVMVLMAASLAALLPVNAALVTKVSLPRASAAARFLAGRLPAKLAPFADALHRSRRVPAHAAIAVLLLGVAGHLLGMLAYWLIAAALALDVSMLTLGWIRSAAMLVAILPISVAGLGVREGAIVVLLTAGGVSAPAALTFALLVFATTVLAPALLGGLIEARRLLWRPRAEARCRPATTTGL